MELKITEKGILQFENARIIWSNFSGRAGQYNREGDRNFSIIIPDKELADQLVADGWNVKVKPPRTEDEDELLYLQVKVKFNEYGPNVYLDCCGVTNMLNEETVGCIDDIAIESMDIDVRPYDWEINGKTGRTAYLQGIYVYQKYDRFADRYVHSKLNRE